MSGKPKEKDEILQGHWNATVRTPREGQAGTALTNNAFTVSGWRQGGLQFYVVTDAAREDADRLRTLLEQANRI